MALTDVMVATESSVRKAIQSIIKNVLAPYLTRSIFIQPITTILLIHIQIQYVAN